MNYLEIPLIRLAASLGLVAFALLISWRQRLDLGKELTLGAVRAAAQLIAIGYALIFLFDHQSALAVVAALVVMSVVAAWTSAGRVQHGPGQRRLFRAAFVAIAAGAIVALVPVFAVVIRPTPFYEARFVVPIAGIILNNGMNTVALVFERVFATASTEAAVIEQRLSLGATPKQALAAPVRTALRAALTPTINGLLTVGLVALPGMMTGQIVSGVPPERAVRYQLVIMYQLVALAAVAGTVAAVLSRRMLFDRRGRLISPLGR